MPDAADPTHEPASFADLPLQPTGSGVADLEIAYEQMRLAEGDAASADADRIDALDGASPVEDAQAAADSAAHPS